MEKNQKTENVKKSFLRIFSYCNPDANRILQDIENNNSNLLRGLSANKTSPVVEEHCTFEEFQDRFISENPVSTLPDSAIGLAFRGQASAIWLLNSSLFRRLDNLKKSLKINIPETCGTSIELNGFIERRVNSLKNMLAFY